MFWKYAGIFLLLRNHIEGSKNTDLNQNTRLDAVCVSVYNGFSLFLIIL